MSTISSREVRLRSGAATPIIFIERGEKNRFGFLTLKNKLPGKFIEEIIVGKFFLFGSAKPLFPDQFTVSMKGPIVLAVPEFRHNQKWAL